MRKLVPMVALVMATSISTLVLSGQSVPASAGWFAVALGLLAAAWLGSRQSKKEAAAADVALGALAEYKLPVGNDAMAPAVFRLVEAFTPFVRALTKRHNTLTEQVNRHELIARHTADLVLTVDADGLLTYVSPSIRSHLGFDSATLNGRWVMEMLHPDDAESWQAQIQAAARTQRSVVLEGRWKHLDGHYVALETTLWHTFGLNGRDTETTSVSRNIEVQNARKHQLQAAAHSDPLTGLPNRAALGEALERFRSGSARKPFAVLLFDLDRFKQVNDSLGHAAGDDYLIEAAARIASVLRENDSLARTGGDEFVGLFSEVGSVDVAQSLAARIIAAVSQPFLCHGALLYPRTSIGIVLCTGEALPADDLLSRADQAMYVAKNQGGNLAAVYDESYGDQLREEFTMERSLELAMQQGRMVVEYQPLVDAKTRTHAMAEALVRMREPQGILTGPDSFIAIAEKTGLIVELGQWVLEQACRHSLRLVAAGTPLPVSINVSPRQLMHVNYLASVDEVLAKTGADPNRLVLEVTESAVMPDLGKALAILNHLKRLGFRLALDDFGSGFSSISMLKSLPFDILKIDRNFVADAERLKSGPRTLAAIIDIGKNYQLVVAASGVETESLAVGLQRLGCDLLQGYCFFPALSADAHASLLRAEDPRCSSTALPEAGSDQARVPLPSP